MASNWYLKVHGEGYTVRYGPFPSDIDAEMQAWALMSHGVRDGRKLYPNKSIVFAELEEEKE